MSEAIYLSDPDGLGIEVYADRPRSHLARVQDGQLVMATEPLDGTEPAGRGGAGLALWSGLPLGTTMGHVHLFVGDLQVAEEFYHAGLGLDKTVWSYPGALFMSAGAITTTWEPTPGRRAPPPAGPGDARAPRVGARSCRPAADTGAAHRQPRAGRHHGEP